MKNFYIGQIDYGFQYLVRLFGKDILRLNIFLWKGNIKRKFLRLFGIQDIIKIEQMYHIFFKRSIWKIGFEKNAYFSATKG